MQLVDVFRARVVDVSEKTLTIAVTGDAGKVCRCVAAQHCLCWLLCCNLNLCHAVPTQLLLQGVCCDALRPAHLPHPAFPGLTLLRHPCSEAPCCQPGCTPLLHIAAAKVLY